MSTGTITGSFPETTFVEPLRGSKGFAKFGISIDGTPPVFWVNLMESRSGSTSAN